MRQVRVLNTALWIVAGILACAFAWVAYLKMQVGGWTWFDLLGPVLGVVIAAAVGLIGRVHVSRSEPEKRKRVVLWWVLSGALVGLLSIVLALWLVFG